MPLPIISGEARLTADPGLRFTTAGTAVADVNLAFNDRRKNQQTGEWEDGDVFFVRGVVFKDHAEHVAESLSRGDAVVVTGRLKTDQWEDKRTGEKRSAASLLISEIGPALRWATARPQKSNRQGGGGGFGGSQERPGTGGQGAQADPWATGPSNSSEPPF